MIVAQLIAAAQRAGSIVAVVAPEIDIPGLARAGVNLADLLISSPDTLEQAGQVVDTLARTGAIDVIVVAPDVPLPSYLCSTRITVILTTTGA